MTIVLSEPWVDLTFMTALSEQRADRLVAFLAVGPDGIVVDVGCGWAELLLRVLEAKPASTGVGLDVDAAAVEHARHVAAARGLAERVDLRATDASAASTAMPQHADAVICIGATHVWAPPVGANDPLHYQEALNRIRSLLPRGGRLVYGEAIWTCPPTPAAIAALGGREDEMISLAELTALATENGFAAMAVHEASICEWDEFESGYSAGYARWLADHPGDHPDVSEVRARARQQHERYLGGYRNVLGLGYLELIAV